MPGTILIDLCRRRAEAMREAVESWKAQHSEAMLATDVEEIVRESLDWPGSLGRLWQSTFQRIAGNQIGDIQEAGKALQTLFADIVSHLHSIRDVARDAIEKGYEIRSLAELEEAIRQVQQLQAVIFAHWPWIDGATVERAAAEYARSEHRSVEEVLRELQGQHS